MKTYSNHNSTQTRKQDFRPLKTALAVTLAVAAMSGTVAFGQSVSVNGDSSQTHTQSTTVSGVGNSLNSNASVIANSSVDASINAGLLVDAFAETAADTEESASETAASTQASAQGTLEALIALSTQASTAADASGQIDGESEESVIVESDDGIAINLDAISSSNSDLDVELDETTVQAGAAVVVDATFQAAVATQAEVESMADSTQSSIISLTESVESSVNASADATAEIDLMTSLSGESLTDVESGEMDSSSTDLHSELTGSVSSALEVVGGLGW